MPLPLPRRSRVRATSCAALCAIPLAATAASPLSAPATSPSELCAPPTSTPVAAAVASPPPPTGPSVPGAVADPATVEAAVSAARNAVACLNAGRFDAVVALTTPRFLETAIGVTDPADAEQAVAFPPLAVGSMGDVRTHDDGRLSLEVVYRREAGRHMLLRERWFFVRREGALLLDALEPLPVHVEGPRLDVAVRLVDHAVRLGQDRFPAGRALVFRVVNAGDAPHEFAVFRVPAGSDPRAWRDGPPAEAEFVGAVLVAPGGTAELALVDLPPTTYAAASYLRAPDGTTDAARGMLALFAVGSVRR